jgi:O-antigen/teichoic acid export membrane protein
MDHGRQMISNTFYQALNYIVATAMAFLFWLVLGKILIPSEYGAVTTASNFIYLLAGLTGLGLAQTVGKLISEDKKNAKIYLRLTFNLVLLSNVVVIILMFIFSNQISSILKFDFNTLVLSAIGIISLSFMTLLNMILIGFQNMKKIFVTSSIGQVSKFAIAVLLIFLNFSSFGALAGIVASFVIIALLQIDLNMFKGRAHSEKIDRKLLLSYSSSAFLIGMCLMIFQNVQYLLLTAFKNTDVTGKFSVAMLMTTPIPVITTVIATSLFPIVSELSKTKNHRKMSYLLTLSFRYSLMLIAPILFWLIPFSGYVVLIFSSAKFLEAATLFPILALASAFLGFANLFSNTLYAAGKPRLNRDIVVASSIIFLISAFSLTYYYSSLGLSIAYLASMLVFFVISLIFVIKYIHFKFQLSQTSKIILSSIISFLFIYLSKPFVHGTLAILLLIPAILIYIFLLYATKFYTREDILIINYFSEKSPASIKKILLKLLKFVENRI